MGDEQGQSSLDWLVIFLDENHCRNRHVIRALEDEGIHCEKHLDCFAPGTEDTIWLPDIGRRCWCLLTTDARIRRNSVEKNAVRENGIRMFYFSRNDLSGPDLGQAVRAAIPRIRNLVATHPAPFTASINKAGEVTLRDTFRE